jgi:uncharacterized membrane protein (Fun14 family)
MELSGWIGSIVGAIIGYALPYIIKVFYYIVNLPFRKELLEGTWHAYHFTRKQATTLLRYEKWRIRRNILNKLIITTEDPTIPDLKYKGVISVERNYLLILLKGVKHKEELQMRFFGIIPTGRDITHGLAMGVDFDNKLQCVVRIMSREELDEEKAKKILSSKIIMRAPGIIGISE